VIRSALLYIILVGMPALGMLAVLRVGRSLKPPASFGGNWRVETGPDSICVGAQPDTFQLVIEQSGPLLGIESSTGSHFEGRVSGEGFTAEGRNRGRIRASRMPGKGGSRFEGTVAGVPCAAATSTVIRATRLQLPGDLTGH
jgi:hypothetical protein